MTRAAPADTAPVPSAPVPSAPVPCADVPGPIAPTAPLPRPRRLRHRTAVCAALTLGAVALVTVGPGPARTWGALLLSAVVVLWGGWPLHRAASRAVCRGAWADVLPAAGLLALLAAGACAAAGPAAVPLVAPAVATTLLLAARGAVVRTRRRSATLPAAGPVPTTSDAVIDDPVGDAAGIDDAALDDAMIDDAVAQARRGAEVIERVADRATDGSACLVAALAVATLGFWLGAGAGPGAALGATAAVLLVAGPRAVGRAASAVLCAATARAVALRAVPLGPRVLERAARVDTVVLCRTGTVTRGVRRLQAVHAADGVDADEALRLAGAVAAAAQEAGGTAGRHPVGAVVAQAARDRFGPLPGVAEFDGYPGLGVRGLVSELCANPDAEPRVIAHATLVGRVALLAEHGIALPPELTEAVERVHAAGTTAVLVSWDGVARAVLEVVDPLRPESTEVVRRLRELGIVPVLLTGDDAGVARGTAALLGVDPEQVLSHVAADERAAAVAALRAQGRTVAVLGGPHDTAALAAADVALVRPGASPVPTGRESRADRAGTPGPTAVIALRDDDPLAAVDALRLARRAVRVVGRALTGSAAVHLLALPAAAAGVLPPLAAAGIGAVCAVAAMLPAVAVRRVRAVPRPDQS